MGLGRVSHASEEPDADQAKAAKRVARLAAMPPRRAWRRMTSAERLLKTAEAELAVYGAVVSPDASAAYEARAAQRTTAEAPGEALAPRGASVPRPPDDRPESYPVRQDALQGQATPSDGDHGHLTDSPVGVTFRHIDMVITLLEAGSTFAIPMKQYGRRQAEDLPAGDGAKFVTVRAEVLNDAARSICLTCSRPIQTYVFDDRGRRFDSIGRLYQIAGNPDCDDHLQPGFTSQMTWVYRVPINAGIVAFEFEDVSDFTRNPTVPPTRIPLGGG
jgi:hypothetical protein